MFQLKVIYLYRQKYNINWYNKIFPSNLLEGGKKDLEDEILIPSNRGPLLSCITVLGTS